MLNKEAALFFLAGGIFSTAMMNFAFYAESLNDNAKFDYDDFVDKVLTTKVQAAALLTNTVVPAIATGVAFYAATHQNFPSSLKLVAPALVFAASTAASMCYKISEVAEQKLDFDCGNLHTSLVIGTMLLAGGAFAATFYR